MGVGTYTPYYYRNVTTAGYHPAGSPITVTLNSSSPVTFTTNPSDQSACLGGNAIISTTATNASSYQWQVNTGSSWVNIPNGGVYSGALTNTLTITGAVATMNNYQYRLTATNTCGALKSNAATLTINSATTIASQPTITQTLCINTTPAYLSVSANGTGILTYQWYSNTSNANTGGSLISGEINTTLAPPTTSAGTRYYYVAVTGNCGIVVSNTATVITNPATVITSQPSPSTQIININTTPASISVTATGTGGLTYNWYRSNDGTIGMGTLVQSGTNNTYFPTTRATVGTDYYYVIVSGTCQTATSNVVTVLFRNSVCSKPGIGGMSSDSDIGILTKGSITINNWPKAVPNGYLVLDSSSKGFVITHVETTTQLSNITPIRGMMVYDKQAGCVKIYRGTSPTVNPTHTGWVCIEKGCNE